VNRSLNNKSGVKYAEAWRDVPTSAEREKIFTKYGMRYSVLWHLHYWDPSRQLVVDTMHCILEGLAHAHFHEFLGLTTASASNPPPLVKAFMHDFHPPSPTQSDMTSKEVKQVTEIHELLMMPAEDENDNWDNLKIKLLWRNMKPLIFICHDLQIQLEKFL
jgi:hypothetical protein